MGGTISSSAGNLHSSIGKGAVPDLGDRLHNKPELFSSAPLLSLGTGTVLHAACKAKKPEVVCQLLSFLSSAPLPTVQKALWPYCCRTGRALPANHQEAVHMAVNVANAKGQTPLVYACRANSPELVRLLLKQGANPWLGDHCGCRTALHHAARAGYAECVAALLEDCPHHMATRQGHRLVNVPTATGLTPLHLAAFYGHREVVTALLAHNANINAATTCESYELSACITCHARSTPMHLAAARAHVGVVRELLTHYVHRMHSGAVLDPRARQNASSLLPLQLATLHSPRNADLARLLHPANCVLRVLGLNAADVAAARSAPPPLGPPPLAALAASALRAHLLAQLDAAAPGQQEPAQHTCKQQQEEQQQDEEEARQQRDGCCREEGDGRGVGAGHGVRQALHLGHQLCNALDMSSSSEGSGTEAGGSRPCSSLFGGPGLGEDAHGAAELGAGAEGDDEATTCSVCFAARVAVAPTGCGHGLCRGCAGQLVRGVARKPLPCPFCRQAVRGFVPAPAAPPSAC